MRIAQPALSRQIQHLEAELRVELFTRLPRGVRLSPAGRALLEDARAVLASLDRATERAQRVERGELGRLRVGCTDSITGGTAFGRIIRAYRREYPEVHLELSLLSTMDQWEALRDDRIDLGFVFYRPPESEVEAIAIGREAVMLALPEKHPLARARSVRLADLGGEPFVWFSRRAAPLYYDQMARACAAGGLALHVAQEANSDTARLNLVAAGIGATWSLGSSVSRHPEGVVVRPVEDLDESVTAHLIWRRDRLDSTGRAFLALVPAD
ncbi:MAG: LysR family transcriptional regulator [Gemmatimonadales bacterium]|nr:LysR family transcriptional regulator [Gemmatimonadales bacterium]